MTNAQKAVFTRGTVNLGNKELLNKEQIGFKELVSFY
jgi:hypothetical protein